MYLAFCWFRIQYNHVLLRLSTSVSHDQTSNFLKILSHHLHPTLTQSVFPILHQNIAFVTRVCFQRCCSCSSPRYAPRYQAEQWIKSIKFLWCTQVQMTTLETYLAAYPAVQLLHYAKNHRIPIFFRSIVLSICHKYLICTFY